jgi:hypothetical protein
MLDVISRLTGDQANDQAGSGSYFLFPNGNVLVASSHWNGGCGVILVADPQWRTAAAK